MKPIIVATLLFGALAGCSSTPEAPYISKNEDGLRLINPNGYVSEFCTTGTHRVLGGIAVMPDAKQFSIGKCNVNLFDKENTVFIFLGEDAEMGDYAEAELDAYLHPGDYLGTNEIEVVQRPLVQSALVQNIPVGVLVQDASVGKINAPEFLARGALVHFAVDSDVPANVAVLQNVAHILRQRDTKIAVIGHADSTYTEAHNMPLSVRRAKKVKEILVSFGVPEDRISIFGRSSHEPVYTNANEQGRAQNRRAEVKEGE